MQFLTLLWHVTSRFIHANFRLIPDFSLDVMAKYRKRIVILEEVRDNCLQKPLSRP